METKEIKIRNLAQTDISACALIMANNELWQRYGVTFQSAFDRFTKAFNSNATILVADDSGKICGFCWYHIKGAFNRSGYIQLIGVDPAMKGLGIGKKLLSEAEKLTSQASQDMFLTVSDFNSSAQNFYQCMGYSFIGAIPDYVLPGITEKIMFKRLRS